MQSRIQMNGLQAALFSFSLIILSTLASNQTAFHPRRQHQQRRRLTPNESIAQHLKNEHKRGVSHPEFTLVGERHEHKKTRFRRERPQKFEIDVVEANPSVTPETTYSTYHDGHKSRKRVEGTEHIKFLVPGAHSNREESAAFALIVVNEDTNEVHGIAQKDGDEMVSIKQVVLEDGLSTSTLVESALVESPADWKCGMDDLEVPADAMQKALDFGQRRTESVDEDHRYHHHHHHHHGDHSHSHSHSFTINAKDGVLPEIDALTKSLLNDPGLREKRRKLYATDSFPQLYTYQVDLYIEIDDLLVALNVDLATSIMYINSLVTAASSIYEREIDTHLHVTHVALSNLYDAETTAAGALAVMETQYRDPTTWHYTDGFGIDLHHAILGRDLGGGIAYLGAVCSSYYGFGVSGGIQGSYGNIQPWDMLVFMHEVGHNFNSKHTHDITGYDPLIDGCGNGVCTGFPSDNSATIMSYCHLCTGGENNILLTFGGYWDVDNRDNLDNWVNNPSILGSNSNEPKRVAKTMYDFVSNLNCVAPNFAVPTITCTGDSDCVDGNSCTVDTCNLGTCVNTMQDDCCGNYVCEIGEASCDDCGPNTLSTSFCTSCYTPPGFMFDVQAGSSYSIELNALTIRHIDTGDVTIYSASGTFSDSLGSLGLWTQVASTTATGSGWNEIQVALDAPIAMSPDETRAFYIISTGMLTVDQVASDPTVASDDYLNILNFGRYISGTDPFGLGAPNYSWVGRIEYLVIPPEAPSPLPSVVPSKSLIPSDNPSVTPSESKAPSMDPSAPPSESYMPSSEPSSNPSKSWTPSMDPSSAPSESFLPTVSLSIGPSASNVPSLNPSVSPSKSLQPSDVPTGKPSLSSVPSRSPSNSPSNSIKPSDAPSAKPSLSGMPSVSPSSNPTVTREPSDFPSLTPSESQKPSLEPSTAPSESLRPTGADSNPPSESRVPSSSPSSTPSESTKPSAEVSSGPSESSAPSSYPFSVPSSFPSSNPSSEPSLTPSASPSSKPSALPSASPSSLPSKAPSGSPSDDPSTSPSRMPSSLPTKSPSSQPSEAPSSSPSVSPSVSLMPSAAPSGTPTQPKPQMEITIPGYVSFGNLETPSETSSDFQTFVTVIEVTIRDIVQQSLKSGQRLLGVKVTKIGDVSVSVTQRSRSLQTTQSLTQVEFDILLEQLCDTNNCDSGTALTNDIYNTVSNAIKTSIQDSTSTGFTAILIENAKINGVEYVAAVITVEDGDLETMTVTTIFPKLYYPDWSGNERCIDDGNEPEYMRTNQFGFYLFEELRKCCEKHFSWALDSCMGTDSSISGTSGTNRYYPDWENKKFCSDDGNEPGYMTSNPDTWLHETLESCCAKHYSWNYNNCIGSAGTTLASGSSKWYVDYEHSKCIQDCSDTSNPACKLASTWESLYVSVDECCNQRLNWVPLTMCLAKSTNQITDGSQQWYVNWGKQNCVLDCESSSTSCGGLAQPWDQLFDSASECCSEKMSWKDDCGA